MAGSINQDLFFSSPAPDSGAVEYDRVFAEKMPLLFEAGRNFVATASAARASD